MLSTSPDLKLGYCEDVLASVKHGSIPPNQDRYFVDTFHFWKGQYSQLLLKYHELEQENAYLKIKNSVQKDATSRQYQANQNSTNDTGDVGDGQAKGCAGLCKICQSVDFQSSFTWRNAVVPQLSTDSHSGKLKTHSKFSRASVTHANECSLCISDEATRNRKPLALSDQG